MPVDPYTGQESGHLSIFSSNPNRPSDFRCEISKEGPWHAYVLLRAEAWASHTLRSDEKKCGIRSVITKTETRGPYTRPFTVYFVHTKTAFKVKSVCKRFSDFKELHQKLKGKHSTFDTQFPPDQVFNSMSPEFVSERRKQLQTYLDEAMAMDHIATDPDLHDFLGIPEYNAQTNEEQHKQQQRERQREHKPEDLKPETFLKVIEKAKLDGDRVSEAQGFNALGLLYCESGLENEGMQCLESSLELCRHMGNTEGMIVTLSNLGCLYNLLDRSQFAVGPFQECFDLLEGDPAGQGEAQMKLSLTCAANGDNYEAIEHCLQCLKLCRQLNDHNKEASCLFTLGSIYYEAGEVRQAVEAFEQCLVLRRKTRDKIGLAEALNKLGLTYCDIGYDLRAMDYFEQSLVICEDNADLYGQAVCLQHLGNVFKMQRDNHLAIEFFERCLNVRMKVRDQRGAADSHDSLGLVYYDLADYPTAIHHYSKSLDIRVELGDLASESECYRSLGVAFMQLEDTAQAIPAFDRCLDIQRKLDNQSGEVDALISLGLANFKAGQNESAVRLLEDALDMFQDLAADDASTHSAKALCLDHLGAVYSKIGKPDKAVTFYTMSLRVKKDIGDMTGEARCLVRIGLEFLLLDQLTRAFEAFTEALHMFERLEDDNGISICYENLGDTYMKMGEKKQAIFSYDRCLPIKVETWDKLGEAQCLDNLGLAHYSAGELRLAAEYYDQSLAIWKTQADKDALMTCYQSLGAVSFQLGEHMRSIECYVQYLTLSQEIGDGAADHEVLLRLGLSNASIGEYSVALQFLQQAIVFYQEIGDNYNRALCLHHIGSVLGRLGNFEEGMSVLKQSLELRTQSQDKLGIADCLEEMGLMCYNVGDYPNARGRFEAAQRLLTETNDKASIATCTMHIGACYAALGQWKEAKQQMQTALMADVYGNWAGKVDCLTHLACVQTELGEDSAIKSLKLGLSHLRDKGNRMGEAGILMQLAGACAKLNDLASALEHLEQCLEVRKSLNDTKGQADALIKMVYVHSALRNLAQAREAYEECYSLRTEAGDEAGQVECLNTRALLAVHEGKLLEAITLNLETLERFKAANNTQKSYEVLNNIGVCYCLSGDYANATKHLDEAAQGLQGDASEAKVLINLGVSACDQHEYLVAIDVFEKALLLCRSQVHGGDKAACQMNLGTVSVHIGDLDRAQVCYQSALSLLSGRGDKLQEARCYHNLGALCFRLGNTKQAVAHFNTAFHLFRAGKDGRAAMSCLHCLKAAHIRLADAFQASQMIHLMQQVFPEDEVRFLVSELMQTLETARQKGDKAAEAAAHIELSDAQIDVDMVAATAHAQKALLVRRALHDKDGEAEAYVRLGRIKLLQCENLHALEAFKKAGVALGEVWREGSRSRVEVGADVALGLGTAYLWLERYEEAVHVLTRCLHLNDELDDKEGAYDASNLLAMAYERLGNMPKALDSLRRGLGGEFASEKGKENCIASAASLISTLFQLSKHEDALRAVTLYASKLRVYEEQKDQRAQANCYWSLGCAYSSIDQLQQAADHFTKCHQLRLLSGEAEGLSVSLLRKGCANLACGNTRAAAEDLDRYLSMLAEMIDRNQGHRSEEHSVENECDASIALAKAYTRLGDITQATDVLNRALSSASTADTPAAEARVVVAFGELYAGLWITKRAIDHYERALNLFVDLGDRGQEALCVLQLGWLNFLRGDSATSIKCLEEASSLSRKSGSGSVVAQCLMTIADIHFEQGSYAQTQAHYDEACNKCREQLDPIGEARGLCGLSRVNIVLGNAQLALEQQEEALKIRQSLGDSKATSESLCLLAEVHVQMGDLRQAQSMCQQARQLSAENSEVLDCGRAELLHARIMALAGDVKGALEHMQKARDIFAETSLLAGTKIFLDPHALGQALSELGLLFSKAGQGERAIDCLTQAEKICFASDDMVGLAKHQSSLALLLAKHATGSESSEMAQDKLRQALDACKKHGNNAGMAECTLAFGQIACIHNKQTVGVPKIKFAIDILREAEDQPGIARSLCLLAENAGVTPMGVVQLQEALDIYRRCLHKLGESETLEQMAELHADLDDPAASCQCWLDCLALKRAIGDIKGAKTCLAALMVEHDQLGDSKRVLEYGAELNEISRQTEDVDKASHALLYLGKAHTRLRAAAAGIEALSAAIQLCESAPNSSKAVGRSAECHELLSQCYIQQGKQAEAVQATKESQRLRARLGQAAPATAGSRSGSQVGSRAPSQVQSQAPSQAPSKAPSRAPSHRSNADAADAPAPAPGIKKSSSILGSLFKGKNK